MSKPVIAIFDFDGTITCRDTFIEFIRFVKGPVKLCFGIALFAPMLIMMKLRLYPNWRAKRKVFAFFFKGVPVDVFDAYCKSFWTTKGKGLLNQDAKECIKSHLKSGHKVVIITASMSSWVKYFAEYLAVDCLISTDVEIKDGKLTGCFFTNNCYGKEKVDRFVRCFPNFSDYHIVAYGDSRGDKEILQFANEGYYKCFRM